MKKKNSTNVGLFSCFLLPFLFLIIFISIFFFFVFRSTAFSAETFYSLTRFFVDLKKDNNFEDIFEARQRLFLEATYEPSKSLSFLISGRGDINYFVGGFSRAGYLFRIHELYFSLTFGNSVFSFGRKILSWGISDGSPLDVVNRPDFSEGLFSEPRFSKVPGILFDFTHSTGRSTIEFMYEPFFTPPDINDISSDWAILSWRSLYRAFEGDKSSDQLKNLLSGQISPVVKDYPSKITDLLMSFGLGLNFSTSLDLLSLLFVAYTGFGIFPVPFFDSVFLQDIQMSPGEITQFDISAAEIVEPLSRGESFVKLVPKRYYVLGGGWSYELSGFLIKNDIAFYLLADLPDEKLKVREFNLFSFAFDVEREIIPNLIVIPGIRGIINMMADINPFIVKRGVLLPSLSGRYETYLGLHTISFLLGTFLDIPLNSPSLRSWFVFPGVSWKPSDKIELSLGGIIMGGDEISLFGFFKDNSAITFSFRFTP